MRTVLSLFLSIFSFFSYSQIFILQEDFNQGLPSGWSNNAVSGSHTWKFGLDGSNAQAGGGGFAGDPGLNNIDGSVMAIFDDDSLGFTQANNTVELRTPVFDNSASVKPILEFDYNFRSIHAAGISLGGIDSFYVEIYDGNSWNLIYTVKDDDCGQYKRPLSGLLSDCDLAGFPNAKIDISPYANKNCQISFRYHDANDWGFYVGLDNVSISELDSNDIGVVEIIDPSTACDLSDKEAITVKLKNFGINPISNFDLSLDIDNGSQIITETITDTLLFEDSLTYTFISKIDFSAFKYYQLKTYTTFNLDTVTLYDTSSKTIKNIRAIHLPYTESFEDSSYCWEISGTNPSWERGIPLGRIIDTASDSLRVFASNLRKPNNDLELSYLTSPCIIKTDSLDFLILSFDLIHNLDNRDGLSLEYSTDNAVNWLPFPFIELNKNWYNSSGGDAWSSTSNGWQKVEGVLKNLKGYTTIHIRFRFITDSPSPIPNLRDGFAIDNIKIQEPNDVDIGLLSVVDPDSTAFSLACVKSSPTVEIVNYALKPISSFDVSYTVNNITTKERVTRTIAPLEIYQYTFLDSIDLTDPIIYDIDFKVNAFRDPNPSNDEILHYTIDQRHLKTITIPYRETFDDFQIDKYDHLEPQIKYFNDFWSASNIQRTNKTIYWSSDHYSTNGYSDNRGIIFSSNEPQFVFGLTTTALITPFIIFDSADVTLSFWYHRYDFPNNQVGTLNIDVFDGTNWQNTIDSVSGRTQDAIDKKVNAVNYKFKEKRININRFHGKKIKIRFRVNSSLLGFSNAITSLDDISIYSPSEIDIKVRNLSHTVDQCLNGTNVSVSLQNMGIDTISAGSILLFYQTNQDSIVKDTLNTSLYPDQVTSFTFAKSVLFDNEDLYNIKVWSQLNGDVNVFNDTISFSIENRRERNGFIENFESFETNTCKPETPSTLINNWVDKSTSGNWKVINHDHCNGLSNLYPTIRSKPSSNTYLISNGFGALSRLEMISGCIDINNYNSPTISIDYHKSSSASANLEVDVSNDGVGWTMLGSIIGKHQASINSPWKTKEFNVSNIFSFVRIRVFSNILAPDPIAIDNIKVFDKIDQDIEALSFKSPLSKCTLTDQEKINIDVYNRGSDTIVSNAITATLFLDNKLESIETITDSILPNKIIPFTFNKTLDLSDFSKEYSISAKLDLLNDSNTNNNRINKDKITSFIKGPGYIEDFESFSRGYHLNNSQNANQEGLDILKNGWTVDPNSISEKYHWNVQKPLLEEIGFLYGGTPTALSGPKTDFSPNGETFVYTEASYGSSGDVALLTFPCADLSNLTTASLQFWYHKFGASMGDLYVDINANGIWNLGVDSIIGETHTYHLDPWKKKVVNLSPFAGHEIEIRFRAIRGNGDKGDMAIDNVHLIDSLTVNIDNSDNAVNTKKDLLLYPNPNTGSFTIQVNEKYIGKTYMIYNLQGRIIQEGIIKTRTNDIQLKGDKKSLYFIRLLKTGIVKKIVIL